MRILFLTYNLISPDQPGSIRAWQIAKYLQRAGHQVTVITCSTNYMLGSIRRDLYFMRSSYEQSFSIVRLNTPIKNIRKTKWHRILHDSFFCVNQAVQCLKIGRRIDLILSASPPILTPFATCLIARLFRVKHVFEVRDMLSEGLKNTGIIKNKGFVDFIDWLEDYCFKHSDGLIAVTPGIKRMLLKHNVPENKIRLVTNGVEDELYRELPDPLLIRMEWGIPINKFVVFFSGTLSSFSNVSLLLECARLMKADPDICFIIAGEGQKRKDYEQFCKKYFLEHVFFVGALPRNEIPRLCCMADVCMHMFKTGPFWDIFLSNKIFDYMGSGTPVIYAGGGDSVKIIEAASGGIVVQSQDPSALKAAILKLKGDPELRANMGKKGRSYVLKHYSRQKLLKNLIAYLEETVQL